MLLKEPSELARLLLIAVSVPINPTNTAVLYLLIGIHTLCQVSQAHGDLMKKKIAGVSMRKWIPLKSLPEASGFP